MLRRALLYLVLVASLATFFVVQHVTGAATDAHFASAAARLERPVGPLVDRAKPLSPDRRFLDAVGEVTHVLAGAPAARAEAKWVSSSWRIVANGREVGRLSEFPEFGEMRRLLGAWAVTLGARESIDAAPAAATTIRGIESQLDALHALRAADLADRAWSTGHHDREIARLGARALVWLDAERFDAADAGEALPARALAWCAIVGALDSTALRSETALLAERMGYPAEACERAASLSPSDPVRLFVLREDETLDAIASRGGAERAARWLALLRTVERHDLEAWQVAAERGIGDDSLLAMPILASALALGRFENALDAGGRLLATVTADLRLNAVTPAPVTTVEDRDLGRSMETFETLLASMPESADGAFLDRDVLRAWYRAAFYSSLFGIGDHLRTQLASLDAARQFAQDMGAGTGGSGPAAEFQHWFADLVAHDVRGGSAEPLRADLGRLADFGAAPRILDWDAMIDRAPYDDSIVRDGAHDLAPYLDSRPDHLWLWASITGQDLFDLPAAERLWAAGAAAAHPRDLVRRGWWAGYRGDRATLERMLTDPRQRPADRNDLVATLRSLTPEDSVHLDALSESIVAEDPDDWSLARGYVASLAERHHDDRVRALTRAWLERPDRSQRAFDDIDARDRLARACLEEGRIDEGLHAIEPVVGSWQENAMMLGAELLDRDGKGAEAETLAVMNWQRYPQSADAISLIVSLWWRHGDDAQAARALAAARPPLDPISWRSVLGPRFAAFAVDHPREVRGVVDALSSAGLDDWKTLGGLVAALSDAGHHDLALDLLPRVHAQGDLDAAMTIVAYRNVLAAAGDSAASAWLRAHVDGSDDHALAMLHLFAFGLHADRAQWILPIPPGAEDGTEDLWLMRAAAAARDSAGTPDELAQLHRHFEAPGANRYRHFARLLLHLEPADSILTMRLARRAEGEACYYLGLRAQEDGHIREAAGWYARDLDLGMWVNGEHHWSMDQLYEWSQRPRSLERREAESRRDAAAKGKTAV